jgi:hypothetical protein
VNALNCIIRYLISVVTIPVMTLRPLAVTVLLPCDACIRQLVQCHTLPNVGTSRIIDRFDETASTSIGSSNDIMTIMLMMDERAAARQAVLGIAGAVNDRALAPVSKKAKENPNNTH